MNRPNPNEAFPNPNLPRLCFIKNVVKNPRIIIGDILLKLRWWDKSIEKIENLMPILSCGDLEKVKEELKTRL